MQGRPTRALRNITKALRSTTTTVPTPVPSTVQAARFNEHGPTDLFGLSLGCCVAPADYFWMIFVLFTITVFLAGLCCTLSVAARWIYKRRMRHKCDGLRAKYEMESKRRKEDELNARKIAMLPLRGPIRRDVTAEAFAKYLEIASKPEPGTEGIREQPSDMNLVAQRSDQQEIRTAREEANVAMPEPEPIHELVVCKTPEDIFAGISIQNTPDKKSKSDELKNSNEAPKGSNERAEVNVSFTSSTDEKNTTKSSSTEEKNSSQEGKDRSSLEDGKFTTPSNSLETTKTSSAEGEVAEEPTQPSPPDDTVFPYFSVPGGAKRVKKSAWVESSLSPKKASPNPRNPPERKVSSSTSSSMASYTTAVTRPLNAYDLRRFVLEGKRPIPEMDMTQSSASRESRRPVAPGPSGFNYLRSSLNAKTNINNRNDKGSQKDCLKSVSYPGLPRSRCGQEE